MLKSVSYAILKQGNSKYAKVGEKSVKYVEFNSTARFISVKFLIIKRQI